MEEFGNYIYFIVFGIIIVSNIIRGAKKGKERQQKPNTDTSAPTKTWSDILRELQGEVLPQQKPQPQPVPVQRQSVKPIKEKKIKPVSSSVAPIMENSTTETPEFEEINDENNSWADGFKDLDTFKRTFVFSEILNKKY